jgi:hypothetical protein
MYIQAGHKISEFLADDKSKIYLSFNLLRIETFTATTESEEDPLNAKKRLVANNVYACVWQQAMNAGFYRIGMLIICRKSR